MQLKVRCHSKSWELAGGLEEANTCKYIFWCTPGSDSIMLVQHCTVLQKFDGDDAVISKQNLFLSHFSPVAGLLNKRLPAIVGDLTVRTASQIFFFKENNPDITFWKNLEVMPLRDSLKSVW